MGIRQLLNLANSVGEFAIQRDRMVAWPATLKIDISPVCNLRCTVCVHADPNGNEDLEQQQFSKGQRMTVDQYRLIIEEVKGKTTAVSLYYLGDPIMHPDLDEMCRIASDAGINVHISTNFSLPLSDDRIRQLVKSGLTHLTVCVDGLSQENYERTRVGGRIDWVLSNLRRVCEYRRELDQAYPKVEVQYIKFQHNIDELAAARRLFQEIGIDQVTTYWGNLNNYTDQDLSKYEIYGPRRKKLLPQCFWPYFSMVIKYNGDVIPCCNYRHGEQYKNKDNPLILGNVFETGVYAVWNSPQYRELRRFVVNPERVESEANLKQSFCFGCPQIFETDAGKTWLIADRHQFEDHYVMERGIPVRRLGSRPVKR